MATGSSVGSFHSGSRTIPSQGSGSGGSVQSGSGFRTRSSSGSVQSGAQTISTGNNTITPRTSNRGVVNLPEQRRPNPIALGDNLSTNETTISYSTSRNSQTHNTTSSDDVTTISYSTSRNSQTRTTADSTTDSSSENTLPGIVPMVVCVPQQWISGQPRPSGDQTPQQPVRTQSGDGAPAEPPQPIAGSSRSVVSNPYDDTGESISQKKSCFCNLLNCLPLATSNKPNIL